jgi:hypothetical protein
VDLPSLCDGKTGVKSHNDGGGEAFTQVAQRRQNVAANVDGKTGVQCYDKTHRTRIVDGSTWTSQADQALLAAVQVLQPGHLCYNLTAQPPCLL